MLAGQQKYIHAEHSSIFAAYWCKAEWEKSCARDSTCFFVSVSVSVDFASDVSRYFTGALAVSMCNV